MSGWTRIFLDDHVGTPLRKVHQFLMSLARVGFHDDLIVLNDSKFHHARSPSVSLYLGGIGEALADSGM